MDARMHQKKLVTHFATGLVHFEGLVLVAGHDAVRDGANFISNQPIKYASTN
jgi:hypothetical protein